MFVWVLPVYLPFSHSGRQHSIESVLWSQSTWVRIWALPPNGCVTLGKLVNLSGPPVGKWGKLYSQAWELSPSPLLLHVSRVLIMTNNLFSHLILM